MTRKYLLLVLLASAAPAMANVYSVSIDTSSLSGPGSLFFSFGPGVSPFDPATATVSGFSGGGTLGSTIPSGAGILPGTLVLSNAAPATYQQAITYDGSKIHFLFSLTGPAISSPNPGAVGGTDFALFLLDGSDNALLTDDPNGSVFDASIAPGTGAVSFATFQPAVVLISAVPEPSSFLLLMGGVALIGARLRRSI